MNKQQKQRFRAAVYVAVLSFAFVCISVGLLSQEGAVRDLSLGLGANLLSVALLFFIVNRFFGLDTDDTVLDRINSLLGSSENMTQLSFDKNEASDIFPIEKVLETAREVDVLGYNTAQFLSRFRNDLIKRVQLGAKVRLIIIEPGSQAYQLVETSSYSGSFKHNVRRSLGYIREMQKETDSNTLKVKGSLECRLTNWIPSCSLLIFDHSKPSGSMKISANTLHITIPSSRRGRLHIIVKRDNEPEIFKHYVEQFEELWEKGSVLEPDTVVSS